MLGPIASGALIDADLLGTGWRMIFLINVPIGAFALIAGARHLPAAPVERTRGRLDLAGMVLAGTGMSLLVFPLAQGHELGWPVWIVALLVASVPVLALFAAYQVRRKRSGATPLVEPGIFARRAYASGVLFSIVFVGSMGGIVLIFNVLLQAGLGYTPWHSAITTAPWAAGAFVGSAIGGMTMAKLGRKIMHAGLVIESVGLLGVYAVLRSSGAEVSSLDLLAPVVIGGIGMGMVFVPLFDIVMAGVEPHEMGSAAGVLQSVNGLGMSLGVAGLGALFFGLVGGHSDRAQDFLVAAEWTALATAALLALAFAVAFWLPCRTRELTA
jgi:MFS family permease